MLKNKEERKKFLEDDSNWNIIYDLKNIGLRYSEIRFKNDMSLIKEELHIFSEYEKKEKYVLHGYRILNRANCTISYNLYLTTTCVEFLKNNELE